MTAPPRHPRLRTALRSLPWWAVVALVVVPVHADGPMLHEYIEADDEEDLMLRTTTTNGAMPAALDTPSGVARAPDLLAAPDPDAQVYGGSATSGSQDARYRIDRDTSRPEVVGYDDPFVPTITPFKRLYAYDAVDEALELTVKDPTLAPLSVGGGPPPSGRDDQFFADLMVDLAAGQAVRIPSVGPGARVVHASTQPRVRFELLQDGAENWFIRAAERRRVRLVMQLAIDRAAFGSEFADTSYAALSQKLPPLPPLARDAALQVLQELGIPVASSPAAALESLVAHFRGFAPSTDRPRANGLGLYRELALSRKGVCRHRSYAFVITALALGIPARMVRNEAHAWVEVYDGSLWHRIDLGGAAGRLDMTRDDQVAQHAPPPDPYEWPEGSESGADLASRTGVGAPSSGTPGAPAPVPRTPTPAASQPPPGALEVPAPEPSTQPQDEADLRPPSEVTLNAAGGEVRRGAPLEVSGRIASEAGECPGARVDIALRSEAGRFIPLGSLPALDDGQYSGAVTVRLDVAVGDYELVASTPGNAQCGPGRSE